MRRAPMRTMLPYASIAGRQQGVITRAQLVESGLSADAVDRRLRSGAFSALHPGVYAIAGSPDSFARRVTAAVLAAGGRAAASHRAAAALLEIGELRPRVEISVPRTQRPRLQGVSVHRVSHLPAEHTVEKDGILVTNRPRTLCDLASVLTGRELELALDHALARRRVRLDVVSTTLESLPANTRGAGVLRALLAARGEGRAHAESPLEQALHALLRRARLRGWVPQHPAAGCRVDVAFPEQRLAVQVDSFRHHSARSDWVRDHTRHASLVEAGWRVLPVTQEDLRRGGELVARIRLALGTFSRAGRG